MWVLIPPVTEVHSRMLVEVFDYIMTFVNNSRHTPSLTISFVPLTPVTQRQTLHIELPSDIIVNGYSRSSITICEGIKLLRAIRQLHWNRLKQTTARVCSQCRSRGTMRGLILAHCLLISLMQMIVLLGITISTTSSFWEALIRKKTSIQATKA